MGGVYIERVVITRRRADHVDAQQSCKVHDCSAMAGEGQKTIVDRFGLGHHGRSEIEIPVGGRRITREHTTSQFRGYVETRVRSGCQNDDILAKRTQLIDIAPETLKHGRQPGIATGGKEPAVLAGNDRIRLILDEKGR